MRPSPPRSRRGGSVHCWTIRSTAALTQKPESAGKQNHSLVSPLRHTFMVSLLIVVSTHRNRHISLISLVISTRTVIT